MVLASLDVTVDWIGNLLIGTGFTIYAPEFGSIQVSSLWYYMDGNDCGSMEIQN